MAAQSKRLTHSQRFQLSNWLNNCRETKRKFQNMTVVAKKAEEELKFPVSSSSVQYIIEQLEWSVKDFVTHNGMPSTATTHKVIALEKKVNELSKQLQVMSTMLEMFMKDTHSVVETGRYEYYHDLASSYIREEREGANIIDRVLDDSIKQTTNGNV
jgi:hypothetical protein